MQTCASSTTRAGRARLVLQLVSLLACAAPAFADGPLQFLRRPDVSGDQLVFESEGDLWLGSLERGVAMRVTSDEGHEGPAYFSPDGTTLAFTAQYDGGTDVYSMDVTGGVPERLTWDPNGATVLGFSPDGEHIVFRSRRGTTRRTRLWQVPTAGGPAELLPVPYGLFATLHDDGRIAYVPFSGEWQNWKRYRGGFADDIWLATPSSGTDGIPTFRKLTEDLGVDTQPVWVGDRIYFVSERSGVANLHVLDPGDGSSRAVTTYDDFEVRYPQTDGRLVVFEYGNGLALHDPASGDTRALDLDIRSDRIHARPRRVSALDHLFQTELGPTGKRILVSARGQILSAPAEEGDVRVVARDEAARCQYPAWAPDGRHIAYVSDVSGEEQVWLVPASGGEARPLTADHTGPLGPIVWSPDSERLLTSDREMRILLVDVASGATTLVDQSSRMSAYDHYISDYRFSPDGKWVAFARQEMNWNWTVHLYEIATGERTQVTDPLMSCYRPAFDPDGSYLVFLADRELSPRYSPVNRYFTYGEQTTKVSMVTLAADTPSPFLAKNDREDAKDDDDTDEDDETTDGDESDEADADGENDADGGDDADADADGDDEKSLPEMTIDVEGIASRVIEVPIAADRYEWIAALDDKLLLASRDREDGDGPVRLHTFDIEDEELEELASGITAYDLSFDRSKLLVRDGRSFTVFDATSSTVPSDDGKVDTGGWTLTIDPVAEWRQMFHETWRIGRDFFYDPGMHGVDWPAVRAKYEPLLEAVAVRGDLSFLQREMVAELNCGHAYVSGGDQVRAPSVPMGYLGADVEPVSGDVPAYRITRILAGDGFDLEARSPLLTPGVDVSVGDHILAVSGTPVRLDQDLQALLVGTAGRGITLTVNDRPSFEDAREVLVEPMRSERWARYYEWVAERRAYVREHGGEDLGYVHIPSMSTSGYREFAKSYYPNLDRDGLIFDVRFNGGGYIHAMLLLQMSSPQYSYFQPRHGASWSRQSWAFTGHCVALCNDGSGSNAEEFADAFQRLGLGPLIGTRTWGGEVGSGGGYRLVDGGRVSIPNYAAWVPEGGWIIEGVGVRPDVVVEDDPTLLMQGHDPQLDAAIAHLREKIADEPVVRPTPPPYPDKSSGGSDQW